MQAVAHLAQARQVLGHGAAAEGAVGAGRGEVAPVGAHLLGRLLVHIGQAGARPGSAARYMKSK
jgi:hypothetical protein